MNLVKLQQLWKAKDLRKNIFFVVIMLFIFRLLAHIPVVGIDTESLKNYFAGNQILGLLNVFTGGGLENFSIVMLGVGPYITASIIFQLLQMVFPKVEELMHEGERGRHKINQWTRMLTVPLAFLQGYGTIVFLSKSSSGGSTLFASVSAVDLITAVISVAAGTIFLMWIGELISELKVGNGISILIFAGILASFPQSVLKAWTDLSANPSSLTNYIIFLAIAIITIAAIVFITEGERLIPISYARQIIGSRIYGGSRTHLPLRVNQAGMIPIIFAVSLMIFPPLVAQFFVGAQSIWIVKGAQFVISIFNNSLFYGIFYFILVAGFTYFYTAIIFQPQQISENLQKSSGFIPGIRPGQETTHYLNSIMNRLVLAGAVFLGTIALLPVLMQNFGGFSLVISGASMLIVVGVVIEIMKQIDSQLIMRHYEGI